MMPPILGNAAPMDHYPGLTRASVGSCPLGIMGNLQFSAEQGGTASASQAGVMFSDIRRFLAVQLVNLMFWLTRVPDEARAQREDLVQIRNNSRHLGNLLGSLTAQAIDEKGQARTARELARLSKLSEGDLGNLKGLQQALSFYLDELSEADLIALRYGVLGCQESRSFVLLQVVPEALRGEASRMLTMIDRALQPRFEDKVVHGPFRQIVQRLSDAPVDGQKLMEPLIRLAESLDQVATCRKASCELDDGFQLEIYLGDLPSEQSEALRDLVNLNTSEPQENPLTRGLNALLEVEGKGRAYTMLNRIGEWLVLRAEESMRKTDKLHG